MEATSNMLQLIPSHSKSLENNKKRKERVMMMTVTIHMLYASQIIHKPKWTRFVVFCRCKLACRLRASIEIPSRINTTITTT